MIVQQHGGCLKEACDIMLIYVGIRIVVSIVNICSFFWIASGVPQDHQHAVAYHDKGVEGFPPEGMDWDATALLASMLQCGGRYDSAEATAFYLGLLAAVIAG